MDTFLNLETWLREVKQQSEPDVVVILIGNMSDRAEHREVPVEQAEAFASKNRIHYFVETSAKTGENVQDVFLLAAKMLYTTNKDMITDMKEKQ